MKRLLTTVIIAMIVAVMAFADESGKLSISSQIFLDELSGKIQADDAPQRARARQRGHTVAEGVRENTRFVAKPDTINGVVYMSAFVRLDDASATGELESLGVVVQEKFLDGKLVTALIPVDKIDDVTAIARVNRVSAATQMNVSTKVAREKTNVDDLLTMSQDAIAAGLGKAYDGTGVLLGVIDTGIDFNHVAFKDASGNSRIAQAYVYNGSTERTYTGSQITSTLTDNKAEDHGTHTASTAGGSSVKVSGTTVTVTDDHANATYGGMAPGATLYLAGVNGLSDAYLANAVNNILTYADNNNMPVVVSNSWGSQIGPHDGTGDVADIYNDLFGDTHPNRVALFAASNDGGRSPESEGGGYHVSGTSTASNPLGSIMRCRYYSDTDNGFYYDGIICNAWTRSTVNNIRCKIIVLNSNTGAVVASSSEITPSTSGATVSGLSSYYTGSLYVYKDYISTAGKTQVMFYADGFESRSYTSSYQSNYTLAVQIYPATGSATIDMWGGNSGYFTSHLTTNGYTWTNGTDDCNMSDEATIANVISIGAYASANGGMDNSYTIGDIADFSSYGTAARTPTGLAYPWITAPGARLIAGVNHNHTASVDNYSYYGSNFNGDLVVNSSTNPYAYMEGTSMATPTAAGIVALWLQAAKENDIDLTVNDVKNIMKETAINDAFTTTGANASHFGNGKIDALAGLARILPVTGPKITATPTSVDFGTVNVGSNGTATITVTGTNLEGNITASVSGAPSGVFALSQSSITAAQAEGGRAVTVTFTPAAGQNYSGTITLSSSNAESVTIALTGAGHVINPTIIVSPSSLAFDNTYVGQSATKTFTVSGADLSGNVTLSVSGAPSGVFALSQSSITAAQANSGNRTVTVTFTPAAAQGYSATVTIAAAGATSKTVTLSGAGAIHDPELSVSSNSLNFGNVKPDTEATQSFTVTGAYLTGDVTLTLDDDNNAFALAQSSATMAEATAGKSFTVTFQATEEGTYNATVTVSSEGAEAQTVALTAKVANGGNATDNYLNIANYASIDEAGWDTSYVNNLYKYTEGDEEAWLTLPIYGAWSSVYYNSHPQKWIASNVTNTSNKYAGASWNASSPLLGSSAYFTSTTARMMGYNARNNSTQETVTFFVSNVTEVRMLGTGQRRVSSNYPASLKVYECTEASDGTLTASTSAIQSKTNSATSGTFTLTATGLDASKIYKVEAATYCSYIGEIGFKTPVNKPTLKAEPTELSLRAAPGETATATVAVSGKLLTGNVSVALSDDSGVFSVSPASLTAAQAMAGAELTVSFSSEQEGSFTGALTLTSGSLSATVDLSARCSDGGNATDHYLNIAKYATIDEAGATVSGMQSIYLYAEQEDNAWLTVSTYGAKQAASTQNWIESTSLSQYSNSWDATDVFGASTDYFGSSQGYSIYGSASQVFYVTNCTQVKALVKDGSSSKATLAVFECAEAADGTLTASSTAADSQQGGASGTAVITSGTLDAGKIYKVQLTGGGSYPDLLAVGFQTPLNKPSLTVDPTSLDIVAQEKETVVKTITVTGARLAEDVTVTLSDDNGVYELDRTSFTIAEATAGATLTVTLHAPEFMGSYRAGITFTSGEASVEVPIYCAVGSKGSAYSNYLDIEKYVSIGSGRWYSDFIDEPYKFVESETDLCAWLTVPSYVAYRGYIYDDEDWTGVGSGNSVYTLGDTMWGENDVFPGKGYYYTSESNTPRAVGIYDETNTTDIYNWYNVTNCTQVKAYGYSAGASSSAYNYIDIYELTENANGSMTMSDSRVEMQTGTTDGEFVLTSGELDASKIYRVYVGGYRGVFYEVAFRTPLEGDTDLAQIVEDNNEYFHYHVTPGNLTAVYMSDDGKTLYCKDDNGYAHPDLPIAGDIDYVMERTTLMDGDYDQSNWVAVTVPEGSEEEFSPQLLNKKLDGVKGTITDLVNPTIVLDEGIMPTAQSVNIPELNTYIIPSFIAEELTADSGSTYFFVTPKPMEVATVTWAMWNEATGTFDVPTHVGSINQAGLHGSITVDFSHYIGPVPTLEDGGIYSFTALNHRPAIGEGAAASAHAPRRAPTQTSTVYVLDGLTEIGSIIDEVVTDVRDINVDGDVKSVLYSNPAGQVSAKPFEGVNIVIITKKDGTRQILKRLF